MRWWLLAAPTTQGCAASNGSKRDDDVRFLLQIDPRGQALLLDVKVLSRQYQFQAVLFIFAAKIPPLLAPLFLLLPLLTSTLLLWFERLYSSSTNGPEGSVHLLEKYQLYLLKKAKALKHVRFVLLCFDVLQMCPTALVLMFGNMSCLLVICLTFFKRYSTGCIIFKVYQLLTVKPWSKAVRHAKQ